MVVIIKLFRYKHIFMLECQNIDLNPNENLLHNLEITF